MLYLVPKPAPPQLEIGLLQPRIAPSREKICGTDEYPYTVYSKYYSPATEEDDERFHPVKTLEEAGALYNALCLQDAFIIAIYGRGGVLIC